MQKFLLMLVSLVVLGFATKAFAQDTNQIATNQSVSTAPATNFAPIPTDPEMQAAARDVFHRIVIFWVIALIGAIVVAGFAIYGAYRKFGIPGVIVVSIILAFGVFIFGGLLLSF